MTIADAWDVLPTTREEFNGIGEYCSNISLDICANRGRAWVRGRGSPAHPLDKRVSSLFGQGYFTHVWRNLDRLFPSSMPPFDLVKDKKQIFRVLRHRATGERIAIGEVVDAFRMWSRYEHVDEVAPEVLDDILALVGALWENEIFM